MSVDATPVRPGRALLGAALGLAVWFFAPLPPQAAAMAGIALWMAVWWLTEAVPIPVTSLLPLVLLPSAGIAKLGAVGASYGNPVIYLFLGGFLLALALEECGLHRRIALTIVAALGDRPRLLVLGFFAASGAISMWISNTATAMLMLPIAMSVLGEPEHDAATDAGSDAAGGRAPASTWAAPGLGPHARLGVATMLAIAYGASIGGMATLVGTAPNLVLVAQLAKIFPKAPTLGFGQWMAFATPFAIAYIAIGWWLLVGPLLRIPARGIGPGTEAVHVELEALGPMRRDERLAAAVFAIVAAAWVFGDDLRLGESLTLTGWRGALGLAEVADGAVAVAGAIVLFVVPSADRAGRALLGWEATRRLPWGLLLLFGGGFALADGFGKSGLSATIGDALGVLGGQPLWAVLTAVTAGLCALTELTSNTATTTLVLPILAQLGVAIGADPRALMVAATLAASCAFMLPVATPPNAIVFGSGRVTIAQMARVGLWFNVVGVVLVVLLVRLLGGPLLGIDWSALPAWAH